MSYESVMPDGVNECDLEVDRVTSHSGICMCSYCVNMDPSLKDVTYEEFAWGTFHWGNGLIEIKDDFNLLKPEETSDPAFYTHVKATFNVGERVRIAEMGDYCFPLSDGPYAWDNQKWAPHASKVGTVVGNPEPKLYAVQFEGEKRIVCYYDVELRRLDDKSTE